MIVVLDTNILISSVFWRGQPYQVVLAAIQKKFTLCLSPSILRECEEKLRNKFRFPEEKLEKFMELLISASEIVVPAFKIAAVKSDSKDNHIIECAVACKASVIVSGDHHLLDLKEYQGISILSAKRFLEKMEEN